MALAAHPSFASLSIPGRAACFPLLPVVHARTLRKLGKRRLMAIYVAAAVRRLAARMCAAVRVGVNVKIDGARNM